MNSSSLGDEILMDRGLGVGGLGLGRRVEVHFLELLVSAALAGGCLEGDRPDFLAETCLVRVGFEFGRGKVGVVSGCDGARHLDFEVEEALALVGFFYSIEALFFPRVES